MAATKTIRTDDPPPPAREPDKVEELCEVFRLLADRGRMRIVLHLRESGEMTVAELARAAALTTTACSQQLRLLRTARLVQRRREGRHAHYSLFDEHVAELVDLVRRHLEEERG